MTTITVAIPVKNGGALLQRTLAAVRAQRLPAGSELELLVCDSGSSDGSQALARRHRATLIEIAPSEFQHGATRNLLVSRSHGSHVAFLTQDATPASSEWLMTLLGAFERADDVALAFGPYIPNDGASPMVARELTAWFERFSPDGEPRVDRFEPGQPLLGRRGFFTDANGMISRAAWERVPFREIAYAEDHALAHDVMRAGFAKVYEPKAGVIHSHDYTLAGWFRRSYEESRALRALYGYREPLHPKILLLKLYGLVGADWRWAAERTAPAARSPFLLAHSTLHHAARIAGAAAGTRATATKR